MARFVAGFAAGAAAAGALVLVLALAHLVPPAPRHSVRVPASGLAGRARRVLPASNGAADGQEHPMAPLLAHSAADSARSSAGSAAPASIRRKADAPKQAAASNASSSAAYEQAKRALCGMCALVNRSTLYLECCHTPATHVWPLLISATPRSGTVR